MAIVFSGVRPSGEIHLGNYLGAIKVWVELQREHQCFYCIVDLHAISTPYNPKDLKKNIVKTCLAYLVAGIDSKKSVLFLQSLVPEHTELAWLLGTLVPVGDLTRMTQYKEKVKKHKQAKAGLLNYPILQSADILLYRAELVPVGRDQIQHIELCREIASRFNRTFGKFFPLPKPFLSEGEKIRSLTDPTKKMSKTDNPQSYISLFDPPDLIYQKILKAVTDSGKEIRFSPLKKPGISNLLLIYALISGKEIKKVEEDFEGKSYLELKKSLAELLIDELEPFRLALKEHSESEIIKVLKEGAEKAKEVAQENLAQVKELMGLRV